MKRLLVFVFALIAVGAKGSAHPSNFQYMVKLEVSKAGQCSVCSGSFIDPNWILTAAHCVHGMDSVVAYIGPPFEGNCSTGYEINKNSIVVHEFFREADQFTYRYDIALIKFTRRTSCRPNKPIRFLDEKPQTKHYRNKSVAFVQFSSSCGQSPALLTVQPVIGDLHCPPRVISGVSDGPTEEEVLCVPALDYGGSCDGDTSTHLVMGNTDVELIGIMTSPREEDCERNEAIASDIIFTDVHQFKPWIINKLKRVGLSSKRSMVKLNIYKKGECSVCSGSFVHPNWILTSAHCVHDASSVVVDVGRHFSSSCSMSHTINKTAIIVHPSFKMLYNWLWYPTKQSHDIALIKFMKETSCERYWIARLPDENAPRYSLYNVYSDLFRFEESCHTSTLTLFTTAETLTVVGDDQCKREDILTHRREKAMRERMDEDQICVFIGFSAETCYGDTSGHLFKKENGELIGIMSRQPYQSCLSVDQVTFTWVGYYVSWIKSHFTEIAQN